MWFDVSRQKNYFKPEHRADRKTVVLFLCVCLCVITETGGSPFLCCVFFLCSGMPTSEETPPPAASHASTYTVETFVRHTRTHTVFDHTSHAWRNSDDVKHLLAVMLEVMCLEEIVGQNITSVTRQN